MSTWLENFGGVQHVKMEKREQGFKYAVHSHPMWCVFTV